MRRSDPPAGRRRRGYDGGEGFCGRTIVGESDMSRRHRTVNFQRRCQAAILHPVIVASVVVLLLNDHVLTAIWAESWAAGKLSDLAWVVFASPLLAFLLSPVAGDSRGRQRVVFLTAYVGLPVLYAGFNTFAPLHD